MIADWKLAGWDGRFEEWLAPPTPEATERGWVVKDGLLLCSTRLAEVLLPFSPGHEWCKDATTEPSKSARESQ